MTESSSAIIKKLLKAYVSKYYNKIGIAIFFMVVTAGANTMQVSMIEPALNKIFFDKDASSLMIIPIIVMILSVTSGIASYIQNFLMKAVGQHIISDMQIDLYQHLLKSDLEFLHSQPSGHLISRFTNDIVAMRGAVSTLLTSLAKELVMLILLIGLMFKVNATLSCITLFVFPAAIYPVIAMGKRMRKLSHQTQEELGKYTARLDEAFHNIRTVRAYTQEDLEYSKAKTIIDRILMLYLKAARTDSLASPIMECLSGVAISAVIWYGGLQVIDGSATPGSFFTFIVAFMTAYRPVKSLSGLNSNMQEGLAAARRYFQIMEIKPQIIDSAGATELQIKTGGVALEQIFFRYKDDVPTLKGVSFQLQPGQTVAFVGESGSGKSTLLNLLLRFYDPQQGKILIDGQDIAQVTLKSLRSAIAVVSQDIMLFDDTIYANIAYGKLGATQAEVIFAAKFAAAHDFISELPDGYDSLVGQQGLKLSGGQKQRISIARALLKNSPILLLDEATSALDPITERQIQQALTELRKYKTTLIIAHRLSTVIDADQIVVMSKGAIVETGTHEDLIKQKGEYYKLYNRQQRDE